MYNFLYCNIFDYFVTNWNICIHLKKWYMHVYNVYYNNLKCYQKKYKYKKYPSYIDWYGLRKRNVLMSDKEIKNDWKCRLWIEVSKFIRVWNIVKLFS